MLLSNAVNGSDLLNGRDGLTGTTNTTPFGVPGSTSAALFAVSNAKFCNTISCKFGFQIERWLELDNCP